MLSIWVFALLSGVANACLSEPRSPLTNAVLLAGAAHHPERAHERLFEAAAHGILATAGAESDGDLDKAPCLKTCDETSQTLLKQPPRVDPADQPALVLPHARWGSVLSHAAHTPGRMPTGEADRPSRPLRVQFSRLAL